MTPNRDRNPVAVDELLTLFQSDDLQTRQQAAIELARREDERIIPPMLEALDDPNSTIRANAATALGTNKAVDAVDALIDRLRHDPDTIVRERTATALAQIGAGGAIPALIDTLDTDNTWLRNRVAYVLGASEDARAVEPLIVLLDHDDAATQGVAAWALGAIGDPRAIAPLRGLLAADDASVRGNAAWALGEFESAELVDDLLPLLADPDAEVRGKTAWALGALGEATGDTRMVEPLMGLLDDYADVVNESAHVYVCQYAAEALAQIGTQAAQAAVDNWKPIAREKLLPRRINDLIRALRHQEPETRERIMREFASIGVAAVDPLITALQSHENARVRQGAAQALGEIGDSRAVHPLVVALADPDPGVWSQATAALGKIGKEKPLRPALASEKPRIKQGAAIALWRIAREERAFKIVLQAIQDDDLLVRGSAIASLWIQPDERAVATLQMQLQHEDGMMAHYILQALDTIGGPLATATIANWMSENRS